MSRKRASGRKLPDLFLLNSCYNWRIMTITPTSSTQQNKKTDLLALTLPQLKEWMIEHGEAAFRAKQVYSWLYQHLVSDFGAMTNLPRTLRNKLAEEASIGPM